MGWAKALISLLRIQLHERVYIGGHRAACLTIGEHQLRRIEALSRKKQCRTALFSGIHGRNQLFIKAHRRFVIYLPEIFKFRIGIFREYKRHAVLCHMAHKIAEFICRLGIFRGRIYLIALHLQLGKRKDKVSFRWRRCFLPSTVPPAPIPRREATPSETSSSPMNSCGSISFSAL